MSDLERAKAAQAEALKALQDLEAAIRAEVDGAKRTIQARYADELAVARSRLNAARALVIAADHPEEPQEQEP